MSRGFEKIAAYIGAAWQIASGFYTIFVYSFWIRNKGAGLAVNSEALQFSSKVMADNLYMVSVTFGMLMVIIGAVNVYFTRMLSGKKAEVKIPIWFIVCSILSFLLTDLISCFAFMISGIIALARNKTIKTLFENKAV
jgi:hypothetical protein